MAKAYVLLSGGVDSSTCVAIAKQEHGSVKAISVHYGQLHSKELEHAKQVADALGAEHEIVDLSSIIGKGGLSDPNLQVPDKSYADLPHGVSPTYVPFRNGLLLAMLASRASADSEAEALYYGAHAEDAENDAYPDCSKPFIDAMREAIRIGSYDKLELKAPFARSTKTKVVSLGQKFGVPWHLTWSCYKGEDIHCGTCPTCRSRSDAFRDAGVKDPTVYKVDPNPTPEPEPELPNVA